MLFTLSPNQSSITYTSDVFYSNGFKIMDIQDVMNIISSNFSNKFEAIPCVNLLGQRKKLKEEKIKDMYNDFIRHGNESIACVSLNTSSDLFHWAITHAKQLIYWRRRIYVNQKRFDLIILVFSNHQITV